MDTNNVTVYTGLQHSLTHYDNMLPNYMYVSCCVCRAIFSDRFVHVLKQVAKNQQDVSMC